MTHARLRPGPGRPQALATLPASARLSLLETYRGQLIAHRKEIAALLRRDSPDLAATTACVHRLAGLAGVLQDTQVCEAARRLERFLREAGMAHAGMPWPPLDSLLAEAIDALEPREPDEAGREKRAE